MNKNIMVYIVDDDESVRKGLKRLIRSAGMDAQVFASGEAFLDFEYSDQNSCLVTDIKMPGMSGLELHQKLLKKGDRLPVVFITGFDTLETQSQARDENVYGYFKKPVDDQTLLDAIQRAVSSCSNRQKE
jgi:FixJ family two-component response regulator